MALLYNQVTTRRAVMIINCVMNLLDMTGNMVVTRNEFLPPRSPPLSPSFLLFTFPLRPAEKC